MVASRHSAAAGEVRRLREQGAVQDVLDRYGAIDRDAEAWADVDLVLEVARAWSLAGNEAQVEKFFLRCADLNQRRAALYRCQIGWFYHRRKRWRRALEWYERSLATFRSYHLCLFRKGYCLERLHRPAEAAATFLAATEVFESSPPEQQQRSRGIQIQVFFHLARNRRETGDLTGAIAALENCERLDATGESSVKREHRLASRAEIHVAAGAWSEAMDCLDEARGLDPQSSVIAERRGRVLAELGRDEEAETSLRQATELQKGAVALRSLARFLRTRGRLAEAARTLQKALRDHPQGEIQLRAEEAALHTDLGRPVAALAILERLAAGRVPEGSALAARVEHAIAAIHIDHGNLSRALPWLEQAAARENAPPGTSDALAALRERHEHDGNEPRPMQDAPLSEELSQALGGGGERLDGDVVSWFVDRGFGFIAHGPQRQTIFFHISHCRGFDEAGPVQGSPVSFIIGRNHRTGKTQAEEVEARAARAAAATG